MPIGRYGLHLISYSRSLGIVEQWLRRSVLVSGHLADLLTTYLCIERMGGREGNPLFGWLLNSDRPGKYIIAGGIKAITIGYFWDGATWFDAGLIWCVVAWNLSVIWRLYAKEQ